MKVKITSYTVDVPDSILGASTDPDELQEIIDSLSERDYALIFGTVSEPPALEWVDYTANEIEDMVEATEESLRSIEESYALYDMLIAGLL